MRQTIPFNDNWLFSKGFTKDYARLDFDDSDFQAVTVPHTNTEAGWHSFDDRDYQFISTYRKYFTLAKKHQSRRIFIDFEGVMAFSTVFINGKKLGSYKGGYTPFEFEITDYLNFDKRNLITVKVDSTERKDTPPFGNRIDYLTFGGIYRDVSLRSVSKVYIKNAFARCRNVLSKNRRLNIRTYTDCPSGDFSNYKIKVCVLDKRKNIVSKTVELLDRVQEIDIDGLADIELWSTENPKLYSVRVELIGTKNKVIDCYQFRTGFRKAEFTEKGFFLNGRSLKLIGLNRHQTYPYIGAAAPARLQRKDALIIKNELNCNIVRTSHYPQSRHFMDCCDETGLLVFEEIPGWQHIGDQKWKKVLCENTEKMVKRDWNRPSVILWGTRVNESRDDDSLYQKTNSIAKKLDDSRQTAGVRNNFKSNLIEDVFTINDFEKQLSSPNHPLYMVSEYGGHMFPTKPYDGSERRTDHTLWHAGIIDQTCADKKIAGCIGWCAFDYNTHLDFGCGDRVCYHGVYDIFRLPKSAAAIYMSQCPPEKKIVLEPVFSFSINDFQDIGITNGVICSNCDMLKVYAGNNQVAQIYPDRKNFQNMPYPPFCTDKITGLWGEKWKHIKIDGYIDNKKVITRKMSNSGLDEKFNTGLDDKRIHADGADMTRCYFYVTDKYLNRRYYSTGAVGLVIKGPGRIVGENPFALVGGAGAVWIKSTGKKGTITVFVNHPSFETKVLKVIAQ